MVENCGVQFCTFLIISICSGVFSNERSGTIWPLDASVHNFISNLSTILPAFYTNFSTCIIARFGKETGGIFVNGIAANENPLSLIVSTIKISYNFIGIVYRMWINYYGS